MGTPDEVLDGLWRFTALHPDWEDETDGWDPEVAWWALQTDDGLVLIDPLVQRWDELDGLVEAHGGCAGILRTCHWHERSIPEAARRYGAAIWARPAPTGVPAHPFDHTAPGGASPPGGVRVFDVARDDEIALWLAGHRAMVFGDVMIRTPAGELTMCPEWWAERIGGHARLRQVLAPLHAMAPTHVLVAHGPLVLDDGSAAMARALAGAT